MDDETMKPCFKELVNSPDEIHSLRLEVRVALISCF